MQTFTWHSVQSISIFTVVLSECPVLTVIIKVVKNYYNPVSVILKKNSQMNESWHDVMCCRNSNGTNSWCLIDCVVELDVQFSLKCFACLDLCLCPHLHLLSPYRLALLSYFMFRKYLVVGHSKKKKRKKVCFLVYVCLCVWSSECASRAQLPSDPVLPHAQKHTHPPSFMRSSTFSILPFLMEKSQLDLCLFVLNKMAFN